MNPLLLLVIGPVIGLAYGLMKGVGKTPGGRAKYAVMCALLGLVAGGVAAAAWTLLQASPK